MNEEELEKLNKEFFGFTVAQIDEDLGRYIMKCSDLEKEKQDLIKYLEDRRIEETELYKNADNRTDELYHFGRVKLLQEILDKIKEGNYE